MNRLSHLAAIEFIETYCIPPDVDTDTYVEAVLYEPVEDVLTYLSNFAPGLDPDSYEITPCLIREASIWGTKLVIRTEETE